MRIYYSQQHRLHAPTKEFHRGRFCPSFEGPKRLDQILEQLSRHGHQIIEPTLEFNESILHRVHDADYVNYLKDIFAQWQELHTDQEIFPHAFCIRRMGSRPPDNVYGRVGYYSADVSTPITEYTWQVARLGASIAVSASRDLWSSGGPVFALSRPPGHHAGKDYSAGYCFLNQAAIAAETLRQAGAPRVAILDVDYHHGNGTQDVFYDRNDVLFVSLHASPGDAYPYFLGYAEEQGSGEGVGFNLNLSMPIGTNWKEYASQLELAFERIVTFAPSHLVVSLGVDTFEDDPISGFELSTDDFLELGKALARMGLPTLFVMEGGYAMEQLGANVGNVIQGFESAWTAAKSSVE